MATQVILPALGMSQDTGIIVRWLKAEGEEVAKGEPLAEIETDKATVEIEAPASGILAQVSGAVGVEIPVGQVIASIVTPAELPGAGAAAPLKPASGTPSGDGRVKPQAGTGLPQASPLASRIAAEHNLDLGSIKPAGKRIQRADVLAHIQDQQKAAPIAASQAQERLLPASPRARRLAAEHGQDLASIQGSGPGGAVLVADVQAAGAQPALIPAAGEVIAPTGEHLSNTWRIMAERTTRSWTSVPHFYLVREVNASRLITWREQLQKRTQRLLAGRFDHPARRNQYRAGGSHGGGIGRAGNPAGG